MNRLTVNQISTNQTSEITAYVQKLFQNSLAQFEEE